MPRMHLVVFFLAIAPPLAATETLPLTYERDIRPIFRTHCFDCHGATEELKGGLDLRLVHRMRAGGESGPAIVPEKPGESLLLERLRNGEMPPGDNKVSLAEIETIQRWIVGGARTARPEPESMEPGLGITDEERSFWAFQPIRRPAVPDLNTYPSESGVRTSIDALIIGPATSEARFAPEASRRTLVMRAYFDLLGLPPSSDEMQRWLTETDDNWYEHLLTELLHSPHYGERWSRHWLDIAGYADSEGYSVTDAERPWAWKYRDWVIQALNDDIPFDQFVIQQLAGDELTGPHEGDWNAEQIRLLTATGFLRMAADGTGSGGDNAVGRNQVMTDTIKIVSTALLGLSVQCAQCHDHRYDPIPQTDYYALRAVFEPALDWQAWKVPNARRISLYTAADRQKAAEIEAEAQKIAAERTAKQTEYMAKALEKELTKYEEPLRTQLREAYQTPANTRTANHKTLLDKHPSVNISPGVLYQYLPDAAEDLKKFDQRIAETRAKKPVEEFVRALIEPPNHAPETKLFHRGDHQQPKQTVKAAGLTVAAPEGEVPHFDNDTTLPTTGRRLQFARWLTSPQNPLFARVIVNRVWMHHFGTGLVTTPGEFGKLGALPSNPELLDWLAAEFMDCGWSLKHLHRVILNSAVWRQSTENITDSDSAFPFHLRRLEAELIRDRMLVASGKLDRSLFGAPVGIQEDDTGQVIVSGEQVRRSLYVKVRRSRPVAMLQAFDAPVMETNCESRPNSTVATQSLMLLNGEFILTQAAHLAERASRESKALDAASLASFPSLNNIAQFAWRYGYGHYDPEKNRTASFADLSHWNGSYWQGGKELPDPSVGWVLLNASGGHPDMQTRSVIRRWTATVDGTIGIVGTLSHGSKNGDGVRGRIVSSRTGRVGEWVAYNDSAPTEIDVLPVVAGDTIDFVTDCRDSITSDSFQWPATILLQPKEGVEQSIHSETAFCGPMESRAAIAAQICHLWELAFCRPPSEDELKLAGEFVASQIQTYARQKTALPNSRSAIQQAMTNLCQALISSNEFLYVE